MQRRILFLLLAAGSFVAGGTTANAGSLDWTLLMHADVARNGLGADGLIGTADDTTDNCNFSTVTNCDITGSPSTGSYSFLAIMYDDDTLESCFDLTGGYGGRSPCICNNGTTNCYVASPACPNIGGGSCLSEQPGSCCGAYGQCLACQQSGVPGKADRISYLGMAGGLGPGTLTTCQEDGSTFETTALHVANSESVAGIGGACIKLNLTDGPYTGAPCGVGQITSGSLGLDLYVGGCQIKDTTAGSMFGGDVVDMDAIAAASTCGYTYSETAMMVNAARSVDPTAEYLMVLCGWGLVPGDAKTPCLAGAVIVYLLVAYTSDNASDCSSPCP